MRRIAFIGIEHADDAALHEALRENLGPDAQVRVFGKAEVIDAARFLVSVNSETQSLDGKNSVAYISEAVGEQGAKRVNKLATVGVTVRGGWSDFKTGSSTEDIMGWLRDGKWREPEPEKVDDDHLFNSFFDDDDDDDDDAAAQPVIAEERPAAPAPAASSSAEEDDLPVFRAPERTEAKPAFESKSFDSMSANDVPRRVTPPKEVTPPAPVNYDDDDSGLPAFVPPPRERERVRETPREAAPPGQRETAPVENSYADDDDIPSFSARRRDERPAPVETVVVPEDSEDEIPVFRPQPVREEPSPRQSAYDGGEAVQSRRAAREQRTEETENDSLPVFTPRVRDEHPAPVQRPEPEFVAEEDDDIPVFRAPRPEPTPAVAVDDFEVNDDDDAGLPPFQPSPAVTERREQPTSRRAVREAEPQPVQRKPEPVEIEDDDEGDDLPAIIDRPAAPAKEKATPRPSANNDDDEDFGFNFAPKTQSPINSGARRQPTIAPEQVRYEDDNPAELEARKIREEIERGDYEELKLPRDTQNVRVKPEPGRVADDRAPQRVVNQRPSSQPEDDDEDDVEFGTGFTPARERPVFVPPAEPTGFDDAFDPTATAPYMSQLEPEAQRAQSTMEQIIKDYDSESIFKAKSKKQAVTFYVTGSHGGAGKTTSTWMMANTVAAALKKDPSRPVFLIEADYENSKLAQRLQMPPERNSGKLAEFFRTVSSDRSTIVKQKFNMFELTEKIIQESIYVNDRGVNIIACPYDLTKRDGRFLRMAIQRSVEYAERQGGYVFIDADTLSNDDILDRTLAAKSTHVIVVSFGDQDHVEDTQRAIHTLVTPNMKALSHNQNANGMGVPKDRIKVFFNKTGAERYEDLQQIMLPYLVDGHLPTVQGLNDGGWIGNLNGGDFPNVVTSYAAFVNRISPMEELRPYQNRRPQKSTPRGGFMKIFGKR